jgi:hypothetical protein
VNGTSSLVRLQNASSTEVGRVPSLSFSKFRETVLYGIANDMRVAALFGQSGESGQHVRLFVVLADSARGQLHVAQTEVKDDRFASLTSDCPQLHLFEREFSAFLKRGLFLLRSFLNQDKMRSSLFYVLLFQHRLLSTQLDHPRYPKIQLTCLQ